MVCGMCFNLLLIRPNSLTGKTFSKVSGIMPPLNLASLASYIESRSIKESFKIIIKILDFELNSKKVKKQLKNTISNFRPDLIGFTSHTNNLPAVKFLARIVKKLDSKIKIVLGGPHPTIKPYETFDFCPQIDYLVCGEGEETLFELIIYLQRGGIEISSIKGLYYKSIKNEIQFNGIRELITDLSSIPPPSRHLLEFEKYLKSPQTPGMWKRTVNIFTQRGCPYNCYF